MTPAEAAQQSQALIVAGRVDEAAALLETHLRDCPRDIDACRLLGRVAASRGDAAKARAFFDKAARIAPDASGLAFEQGTVALMTESLAEAEAHFQRAVRQDPDHGAAWFNLGWALRRRGENAAAIAALRQAVRLEPNWQALFNLGCVLLDSGFAPEAVAMLRSARDLRPQDPGTAANLGTALWRAGQVAEAEECLRQASAAHPESVASGNLGNLLTALGRIDEAVAVLRRAIASRPGDPTLWLNLGLALVQGKDYAEAETILRNLVAAVPDMPEAWNALGSLALRRERLGDAREAFGRALALRPAMLEALNNLANVAATQGDVDAALDLYRQAHATAPHDAAVHSNLLFHMTHMAGLDPAVVFEEHRRYGRIQEALAPLAPPQVPPLAAGGRLRVGYVSPDFCDHALNFWFEAVLANHDSSRFEVVCYHTGPRQDHVTQRLKGLVALWRSVHGATPDGLAAMIQGDGIHILVDLAGHTAHNALPAFARKPAPVQVSYLGYPNTTGLTRIDYRLVNSPTILPVEHQRYTETLVALRRSAVFRPPQDAPPVTPLPMAASGRPRFGSFNKAQKISAPVYDLWAELLRQEPQASLLMVVPGGDDPDWQAHYRAFFEQRGIAGDRVDTVGLRPLREFMEVVSQVDVALDPFPYGGGTTTLITLWMGVPVICLYGEGPADGVSAGSMHSVGLPSWAAYDRASYLAAAREAVADADALAALRGDLRRRMARTVVMQERDFVAELEQCYLSWGRDMGLSAS